MPRAERLGKDVTAVQAFIQPMDIVYMSSNKPQM